MRKITVCYISATANKLGILSNAAKKARDAHKAPLELIARSQHELSCKEDIESFLTHVKEAEWLIISLMGGKSSCPGFDSYVKHCRNIHIQAGTLEEDKELSRQYSTDYASAEFARRVLYLKNGGIDNVCNLLLSLCKVKDVAGPQPVLCEGIYHPRSQSAFISPRDYFKWHQTLKPELQDKPVIALWLYQSSWVAGDLEHAESFVNEIEKQQCRPLCVFSRRAKDEQLNNKSADEIAALFFKEKGKAFIDVLINTSSMSLAMMGKGFDCIQPGLDVAVLQAICTQNDFKTWSRTEQAVTPVDVSCAIAQPEFDGNLITVVAATREKTGIDPLTGAALKRHKPVTERVEKIVKLAKKWAFLRHIG
ncbi:MAG: cobaltochelatase subunit CobN, partial [Candidatus Omnitrophota bacterium]|nr:cobaltochelatase subunit CobN [Candidatus Omnitrophota bacterium]